MPFAASRCELIDYIKDKDDNLNPILREIFADGFEFYGVEENHPDELININYYSDYESLLWCFYKAIFIYLFYNIFY